MFIFIILIRCRRFHVDEWDVGPLLDFYNGPPVPIYNFDSDKYKAESACPALGSYNKEKVFYVD